MSNRNLMLMGGVAVALTTISCTAKKENAKQPNLIYILVDDMGYGDPSCYGQTKFTTPNIDKLAEEGMLFTDHYAGSSVSAPSRAVLMSGIHTGHNEIRSNKELEFEGQTPVSSGVYTMAEMFKDAGYNTGVFGKWGMGFPGSEGDPNMQGFDEFFGYNCQRHAHRYYPEYLWHNQERVILEGNDTKNKVLYAPDLIQERTLDYIRDNKDNPFFAYVAIVPPHAELLVPDDEILQSFIGKYPETPYVAVKPGSEYGDPEFDYMPYCSQPYPHATFASMITRVDKYVGEIIDEVKRLGIEENTIIMFSSDNGCHLEGGADPDFFNSNGPHRGYKARLTDGGIRIPMIASWKGKIKAGSRTNLVSAFWDVMPTMADILGVAAQPNTDGISFAPTLLGKDKEQKKHQFLYWENVFLGGNIAVRMGEWKGLRLKMTKNPDTPIELYNIVEDPEELNNVADKHPDIVKQIDEIMKREHTHNPTFEFIYEKNGNDKAMTKKK